MKAIIPFLCLSVLLSATGASAQQFLNGSFEPAGNITPCADVAVATYNANMGNNRAVGNAANMQVANSTCGQGAAVDGSWFGVLKYDAPFGNKIVFKLDKAMQAGTTYSYSIHYKVPVGIPPAIGSLRYGYSKDSTSTDSISGYTGSITTETWVADTFSFTPQQPWQYIWIELSALGGDPYTVHVDHLEMQIEPNGVNDVEQEIALALSPNPATGTTTLTAGAAIALPYMVEVYDLAGRVLLRKNNLQDRKTDIDITGVSSGMLFLKLTDGRQQVHTSKLLVQ